jgi:hypothetical protein
MENIDHKSILKYAPICYLHSKESYYPASIEYILRNTSLYLNDAIVMRDGQITTENILDIYLKYRDRKNSKMYFSISSTSWEGEFDLVNVPIYYTTYCKNSDTTIIQFIFLFPYNGAYKVCGLSFGEHEFDVEHVSVEVCKGKILRIHYSAHGHNDGITVESRDIIYEFGRPVVFLAKGSHATYSKNKTYCRAYGLANDHTNYGTRWKTENLVHISEKDEWNALPATLGKEHVPSFQYWWKNEETTNTNCCRRVFCPCM